MKKYIDKDTYEIYSEENINTFEIDSILAPVISLLNRKGYHTLKAALANIKGKEYKDEYMSRERYNYLNRDNIEILKEDGEDLQVRMYEKASPFYIEFNKKYSINLPKGFKHEDEKDRTIIKYDIETSKKEGNKIIKKSQSDIIDENKKICMKLYDKILELEDINENSYEKKTLTKS